MVKNTKGGKGAKGLARKSSNVGLSTTEKLRLATDSMEQYACVTKMFGNGMCEITLNTNEKLVGHIRGAFRGRQKHRNFVTVHSIVLVGLREWEDTRKNCDLLYIYDDNQVDQLKSMPQIDIKNLVNLKTMFEGTVSDSSNINFTNETEDEIKEMLDTVETFTFDEETEVDISDI